MWPAAVRFFFFLSLSFLLLFHRGLLRSGIFISVIGRERALGRRTEDTGEDVTRHRRLRERMEAKEGQMARAGGLARANQAHGIQIWCPVHFNGVSHPAHPLKKFLGSVLLSYYAAP